MSERSRGDAAGREPNLPRVAAGRGSKTGRAAAAADRLAQVIGDEAYEAALARPYPIATAGDISALRYDAAARRLELNYTSNGETTEIFLGAYAYPGGREVAAWPDATVADAGDAIRVVAPAGTEVKILVVPAAMSLAS